MVVAAVVSPSLEVLLSCNQGNFTCPGDRVSCRCDEALLSLVWSVRSTPDSGTGFFSASFTDSTDNETSDGVYTAVVCDVTKVPFAGTMVNSYTSKLNFVLMETATVICNDNRNTSTVLLQRARRLITSEKIDIQCFFLQSPRVRVYMLSDLRSTRHV